MKPATFWKVLAIISWLITAIVIYLWLFLPDLEANEIYTNDQIANAIYLAEGGAKTKFPYGIKSIPTYGNKEYAREICLNTIRNNKIRFTRQNKYTDFLEFLGSRYCPPSAHKLNRFWVKNVSFYLVKLK